MGPKTNFITYFKQKNVISLLTGLAEMALTVHGISIYSTLEYKMREENYFNDETESEQALTYSRIYTLTLVVNCVHKILIGILQDTLGIWISRSIVQIEMIIGLIILIICNPENDYLAYYGIPLYYRT